MKHIKEIIIGIFAVIGFTTIITGFTPTEGFSSSHESHVWELKSAASDVYMWNKKTGEVRVVSEGTIAGKGKWKALVEAY